MGPRKILVTSHQSVPDYRLCRQKEHAVRIRTGSPEAVLQGWPSILRRGKRQPHQVCANASRTARARGHFCVRSRSAALHGGSPRMRAPAEFVPSRKDAATQGDGNGSILASYAPSPRPSVLDCNGISVGLWHGTPGSGSFGNFLSYTAEVNASCLGCRDPLLGMGTVHWAKSTLKVRCSRASACVERVWAVRSC